MALIPPQAGEPPYAREAAQKREKKPKKKKKKKTKQCIYLNYGSFILLHCSGSKSLSDLSFQYFHNLFLKTILHICQLKNYATA